MFVFEKNSVQAWFVIAVLLPIVQAFTPALGASQAYSRGYTVIPQPQKVELKGGDFEIGGGWRLEMGPGVKPDDVAVESLKEGLETRHGITLETRGRGKAIELEIQPGSVAIGEAADKNKQALEDQAYSLELAGSGIKITANAPAGLFYGVETLVQLVKHAEGKLWLPEATITDWPDLEQRNIYWDDNHHLERMAVLKQALRQAAFYKINGFAIKLNDHFEYKSAPALVNPYALTPAQLQELTNYGLKYHVQLIPFLDGPAHVAFILKHPEYAKLREYPDSNYELCTTNPDSYKLLEGMYQDLLDATRGAKYFLLSTDEPYYVGLADNAQCHSAERTKQLGSVGKVLAEFVTKTADYLHARGRKVIFWGEYPLRAGDISSLPSYIINGEVNGPEIDRAYKARGIPQMFPTSNQGEEPYFPNYYALSPSQLFNPVRIADRLGEIYRVVSFDSSRQNADLMGIFVAGWGDEGLHPETLWLGYATGPAWAWHPGSPSPAVARDNFYHLFYGQGGQNVGRLYQLMSTQAEFWDSSWDRQPSSARKPIFGNSYAIFNPRQPEHDQVLPLPPVPQGKYLRLGYDWGQANARRVKMAEDAMPANDELLDLLHKNLRSVQFQKYNLRVYLSIAGLYRQNLEMIREMSEVDGALKRAQEAAAEVKFSQALAALDRALDTVEHIRDQRNVAYHNAVDTWYESWHPRVAEANGRKYLDEVDDVKDHLPMRTVDMSYLVYRELILPLGEWYGQVLAARNEYAAAHGLAARTKKFDWKEYKTPAH
ncbi:MAG TPA: beta-N-acetylhexosaminidase [Terriglobia bacterium]|nr:beta-N-acetylhexosaminidase [Terriglobia bacterium]